jgi:hypothetical protein
MPESAPELRQPTVSELLRYLAMLAIDKGAAAAGTPRLIGTLGAQLVQASENATTNRILGRPQDTRDFRQSRGYINFPTTEEARQWLLKRAEPYLPADTGWKPPIERAGILSGAYD